MSFHLFFILLFSGVKALINPHGPTVVNDITNCVNELIQNNFDDPGLLVFAIANNLSTSVSRIRSELLQSINEKLMYSVQILSPESEVPICDSEDIDGNLVHLMDVYEAIPIADYVVIVIDSYIEFSYVASKLIRSRSWNPHAKFLILIFNFDENETTNIKITEKILTCLFRFYVINVIVVVPQANNIRNAVVYSWRPYDPPEYCGYFNETAKGRLLIENKCVKGVNKHKANILIGRVPNDMQGCVLHILALERLPFVSANPGHSSIEKLLVNQLFQRFNFTPYYEVIDSYRGERDEKHEWNGALSLLLARNAQILLGGIFPDYDVHEDFESSSAYLADSYTWVVPRAFLSPPWLALIMIFKTIVWIAVMSGFFACVLSWKFIGQLSGDSAYHRAFDHCFLNTWICSFGFCAYNRPVTESLRVFFVFLNLYCILFLTAYQTKLFDVLTNPSYQYQIQTVEELVDSGLKFGGSEELRDLFFNSSDPFDYLIGEQWINVDDIERSLIDVVDHRNFSLLCSRLELLHLASVMPELSDNYGNLKFYAFSSNTFSVPMEMIALKGFAFVKEFSHTLGIFKQCGINASVRRFFAAFNLRKRAQLVKFISSKQADVRALSLEHLEGGFFALAWGYMTGVLVLLLEICINSNYVADKFVKFKNRFVKKFD